MTICFGSLTTALAAAMALVLASGTAGATSALNGPYMCQSETSSYLNAEHLSVDAANEDVAGAHSFRIRINTKFIEHWQGGAWRTLVPITGRSQNRPASLMGFEQTDDGIDWFRLAKTLSGAIRFANGFVSVTTMEGRATTTIAGACIREP